MTQADCRELIYARRLINALVEENESGFTIPTAGFLMRGSHSEQQLTCKYTMGSFLLASKIAEIRCYFHPVERVPDALLSYITSDLQQRQCLTTIS